MKYALIKLAGKQYKVSVGDTFSVDKLAQEVDKKFDITDVLLVTDGEKVQVGTPLLGEVVVAKVIEQKKDKKIRVATYKAKSRYRKVKGHRQHKSVVEILSIGKAKKSAPKAAKPAEKKPAAKKPAVKSTK